MNSLKRYRAAVVVALTSAASIVNMLISSLAGLYIARALSKPDYGQLTYFTNWFPLMLLVLGLGLSTKAIKEITELRAAPDQAGNGLRLYSLVGLRMLTLAPLPLIGGLIWISTGLYPYCLVAIAAACAMLSDFLLGVLCGYSYTRAAALLIVIQPLVNIILLIGGFANDVEGVLTALGASYAASVITGAVVLYINRVLPALRRPLFSAYYARRAFGYASKIYLIGILQVCFVGWISIMLGMMGEYTLVAELSIPINLVLMFSLVIGPVLNKILYQSVLERKEDVRFIFYMAAKAVLVVSIVVMVLFAVYADSIVVLLYTERYIAAVPLLVVQSPLVFLLAMESLMTITQIALERFRAAVSIHIIRLLVLVIGSIALVVFPGSDLGLSLSWMYVAAGAVGLLAQAADLRAALGSAVHPARIALALIAVVALALAVRLTNTPLPPLWDGLAKVVVTGGIGCIVAFVVLFAPQFSGWFDRAIGAEHSTAEPITVGKEISS